MKGSPYRVFLDGAAMCSKCGTQGQSLLTADARYLPAFYICGGCGHVGQSGVGPAKGHVRIAAKLAKRGANAR